MGTPAGLIQAKGRLADPIYLRPPGPAWRFCAWEDPGWDEVEIRLNVIGVRPAGGLIHSLAPGPSHFRASL
jgi:hypothetical protein